MTRNILLVLIIVLLLWQVVILCDIRASSYCIGDRTSPVDKNEPARKPTREPTEQPGRLIPKPQWNL